MNEVNSAARPQKKRRSFLWLWILLLLFSSSVIMISLGVIGYYIARIYEEIKGRPRYIVSAICGREEKK